jgi:hypothetical protein
VKRFLLRLAVAVAAAFLVGFAVAEPLADLLERFDDWPPIDGDELMTYLEPEPEADDDTDGGWIFR